MPEEGELLLEVDVDAAEEHAARADVLLVGADGGVGGDQERVVAQGLQGGGQGVVAHAAAAEVPRGAGGDVRDPHGPAPSHSWRVSARGSGSQNEATNPARYTKQPTAAVA